MKLFWFACGPPAAQSPRLIWPSPTRDHKWLYTRTLMSKVDIANMCDEFILGARNRDVGGLSNSIIIECFRQPGIHLTLLDVFNMCATFTYSIHTSVGAKCSNAWTKSAMIIFLWFRHMTVISGFPIHGCDHHPPQYFCSSKMFSGKNNFAEFQLCPGFSNYFSFSIIKFWQTEYNIFLLWNMSNFVRTIYPK